MISPFMLGRIHIFSLNVYLIKCCLVLLYFLCILSFLSIFIYLYLFIMSNSQDCSVSIVTKLGSAK